MYEKHVDSHGQLFVGVHVSSNSRLQGKLRYGRMSWGMKSKWGVSKHWTGFSTGMWDWNVGLDYQTGLWDWNSVLAPKPMLAGTDNKFRQGIFNYKLSVKFISTRWATTLSKLQH